VVLIKAEKILPLAHGDQLVGSESHDFH
jgi:hypothetical protein